MALSKLQLSPRHASLIADIGRFFQARRITAYACGGFLRDALLGVSIHDIDISTQANALAVGRDLAREFGGHFFPLAEDRQMARVLLPNEDCHIDLLPLRGSIEKDLRGRDYTIDALGALLSEVASGRARIIDPTGGRTDLKRKAVRATAEAPLLEDPLRLLRGARLATQLEFRVEPGTAGLIQRHAARVTAAAAERQRDELVHICATPRAGAGFRLLDELGLLAHVLPEAEVMRGVEQPKEHRWDVLGHAFAAVENVDLLLTDSGPRSSPEHAIWRELWRRLAWWDGARDYFREEVVIGTPRSAVIKLCAFLHDIGKPEAKTVDKSGRMRFFGHSEAGARIAVRMMQRLRHSARETGMVRAMIEAHLRPVQMAQERAPTRRAVYRFFRDTGEAGIDTLFLSLADHLATVGPRLNPEGWRTHVAVVSHILAMRFQDVTVVAPPKLLRGDELMAELGLEPGPLVGELLEAIREAQAAGEIASRKDAIVLARRRLAAISPA